MKSESVLLGPLRYEPGFMWCAERRRAALFTLLRQQNVGILAKFLHDAASRRISSVATEGNTRILGYVSQSLYLTLMSDIRHDESGIPSLSNSSRGLYSLHPFSDKNCCSYEKAKTYETDPVKIYDLIIVSIMSQLPSSGMNDNFILRKSFVIISNTLLPCLTDHDASSTDVYGTEIGPGTCVLLDDIPDIGEMGDCTSAPFERA